MMCSSVVEDVLLRLKVLAIDLYRDELTQLKLSLSVIKTFLVDAEAKKTTHGAIKDWVENVEDAVYEADDLVDDLSYADLQQRTMKLNIFLKGYVSFFSFGKQLFFSPILGQKIKKVSLELKLLEANGAKFQFAGLPKDLCLRKRVIGYTNIPIPQQLFFGREEEKNLIKHLLTDSNSMGHYSIIPIAGIGGIGKTTLAELLYSDEEVAKHFERLVWVPLSEVDDVSLILSKIVESLARSSFGKLNVIETQNILCELIGGTKYLLVLDDLCVSGGNLPEFKSLIMGINGMPGSRVLITTRRKDVAETMGTIQPFVLSGLDEQTSWSLFEHVACQQEESPDSAIIDIAMKINKKCAGVPLSVKTVASSLDFENSVDEWLLLDGELGKLEDAELDVLKILELCYGHLPFHLKACFAYFSLFPRDYQFDVDSLIQLWMGEGFIKPLDIAHRVEDVGHGYLMELYKRSFLQDVELDDSRRITSFKLHGCMHELARLVAPAEIKLDDADIHKKSRRVSFNFESDSLVDFQSLIPEAHKLRTVLSCQSKVPCQKNPILLNMNLAFEILRSCKNLRVLDLHGLKMEKLPCSLGDLTHLRYLDLSENSMISLPSSITRLFHLKTLKLSSCRFLRELPQGIGNMVNLRHLELNGCDDLHHMPRRLGQLNSLQTLSRFVVAKEHSFLYKLHGGLQELGGINDLRGSLEISNLEHLGATVEAKAASLNGKQHLQELALSWCREDDNCNDNCNDTEVLEHLLPNQNLKAFFIRGYGGLRFPSWCSSFNYLVKFTLQNCPRCKCLPGLHQLSSLESLELIKLDSLEFISDGGVDEEFPPEPEATILPSLKTLTILDCQNLKSWWKSDPFTNIGISFPCVSKLDIRYCPQLTSIPHYPNLEELNFVNVHVTLIQQTRMMMPVTTGNVTIQDNLIKSVTVQNSSVAFISSSPAGAPKLKSLHIADIDDLETLPNEWFRGFPSLQSLTISGCPRLKSISNGIQHLSTLVYLKIKDCNELDLSTEGNEILWRGMSCLRSLTLWGRRKGNPLPPVLQFLTSLQVLRLYNCPTLKSLPEWLGSLTSLNKIEISKCHNLSSLPNGMRDLTLLHTLKVSDCPVLLPRLQPQTGEDWPKVDHVPNFSLKPAFKGSDVLN